MDLPEIQNEYLLIGLALTLVVSLGYTYTISQDIDGFQDEPQVLGLIEEQQEPLIDEFDSVIQDLDGNITEVESSVDSNTNSIGEVETNTDELRNQSDMIEESISDLESQVAELEEYVDNIATVEISEVTNFGDTINVDLNNQYSNEVQATVEASWEGYPSQTDDLSIDRFDSGVVQFTEPQPEEGEEVPEVELSVDYEVMDNEEE